MSEPIKRGGRWFVQVRAGAGGVRSKSRTFDTKAEAVVWAKQERALIDLRPDRHVLERTVELLLDKYGREVSPTHKGVRWERVRLTMLIGRLPFAARPARLVTAADAGAWRDVRTREVGPATVRREIGLLRAAFEVARREWGWVKDNPFHKLKLPPAPAARKRVVSDAELDALCASLNFAGDEVVPEMLTAQTAIMFRLSAETGMRAGEMLALTWQDVRGDFVVLPATKNGDRREVPLSSRAIRLVELMRGVDAARVFTVTAGSRDALFRKARARCGLEDVHFHDARATAATRFAGLRDSRGAHVVDPLMLARIMGWRNVNEALTYYRESASAIARALG